MFNMAMFQAVTLPTLPETEVRHQEIFGPLEYVAYNQAVNRMMDINTDLLASKSSVVLLSVDSISQPDFIAFRPNNQSDSKLMQIRLHRSTLPFLADDGNLTITGNCREAEFLEVEYIPKGNQDSVQLLPTIDNAEVVFWGQCFPTIVLKSRSIEPAPSIATENFFFPQTRYLFYPIAIFVGSVPNWWNDYVPISSREHIVACIPSFGPSAEILYPTLDRIDAYTYEEAFELYYQLSKSDSVEDTLTVCAIVFNEHTRRFRVESFAL